MSLHVICPGCLKRFQVSVRFAGMKGPCPNCNTIIAIPAKSVKMQDKETTESETPQKGKGRVSLLRPFPRLEWNLDPVLTRRYTWGVLGMLLLTFILGCIPMPGLLRSFLGIIVLGLSAFPLTVFGYQVLLDRGHLFALDGEELYRRSGVVAAGFIILWLVFEYFLVAAQADSFVCGLYFAVFALLAALLVHPVLELKLPDAMLHFCLFAISITILRFFIGLGWFWESNAWIRYSTAPPAPLLPGM